MARERRPWHQVAARRPLLVEVADGRESTAGAVAVVRRPGHRGRKARGWNLIHAERTDLTTARQRYTPGASSDIGSLIMNETGTRSTRRLFLGTVSLGA